MVEAGERVLQGAGGVDNVNVGVVLIVLAVRVYNHLHVEEDAG